MRLRRKVAAFAVAISAASIALVGVPAPALATGPVDWSTSVDPAFPQIFTAADGSVTQTACNSTSGSVGSTTYASDGTVQSTIPTTTDYYSNTVSALSYCGNTAAVDSNGTLYGNVESSSSTEEIGAYSAGTKLWSQLMVTTDCPSMQGTIRPYNIKVGADGNVYVAGRAENDWCGHWNYLASFTSSGTLRWQIQVVGNVQQMAPYAGGLATMDSWNNTIRFYDYDGNAIASQWITEPTSGGIGVMSVSTSGIVSLVVQGSPGASPCNVWQSSYIVAYGSSGEVFSKQQDACWTAVQAATLSDGGFAYTQVHYPDRERKLVVLSGTGSVISQRSLETPDGIRQFSLDIYNSDDLIADTNGNLLLMRGYSYTYNNQTQYGLQFDLVDPATGAFMAVFNTDTVDTNAKLSYRGAALSSGKFYFLVVDCTSNNCSSTGDTKLYAVQMAKLGMDYPRGALLGVQPVAFGKMAVGGDSFSSGVGSLLSGQSYEAGTNVANGDKCLRSPNAYARKLVQDPLVKLKLPADGFVACSGATTDAFVNEYNTEPAQATAIPADVKSIFITIGGNNVKFSRLGALCIFLDCSTQQYQDEFAGYLASVQSQLQAAYAAVLDHAPGATLYVIGYPHILPLQDCTDSGSGWWWFGLQTEHALNPTVYSQQAEASGLTHDEAQAAIWQVATISGGEASFVTDFEDSLNATINLAVADAEEDYPGRIFFIGTAQSGSPLEGHELCSSDPYFNGLDGADDGVNTFHPNAAGQDALAQVAHDALAAHQSQYVLAG